MDPERYKCVPPPLEANNTSERLEPQICLMTAARALATRRTAQSRRFMTHVADARADSACVGWRARLMKIGGDNLSRPARRLLGGAWDGSLWHTFSNYGTGSSRRAGAVQASCFLFKGGTERLNASAHLCAEAYFGVKLSRVVSTRDGAVGGETGEPRPPSPRPHGSSSRRRL